jgi:hypothetical protein
MISMMVSQGYPFGLGFIGLDQDFNEIAAYHAVDGYSTNDHEVQLLEDGGYLLIGGRTERVDVGRYVPGGQNDASVHENVIQEFTAGGEMIFQWRTWDHFDLRDIDMGDPRGASIDFTHMNALDIDDDGHIIVSSRHMSEVTKINRDTGEVMWRLSGARNDFRFINDPLYGFRNQHDCRALGNGRYTIFDNGNGHNPAISRAVEYELDVEAMTATLVWEYSGPPERYANWMGNAQRLPNGNTLINFVMPYYPKVVEVDRDGRTQFELNYLDDTNCYRVFRFPWDGKPAAPYLIVEPQLDNVTLIFNKFNDPDVSHYVVYAGQTPHPREVYAVSDQTLLRARALEDGQRYYFRVKAVDVNGRESPFSNEENVRVNLTTSNANMVRNGTFISDISAWEWTVGGSAQADCQVVDSVCQIDITRGGTQMQDIQLSQSGMLLLEGDKYVFEFSAWADKPALIEVKVEGIVSRANYSRIGYIYVTPQPQRYLYSFTMMHPTDINARVAFNLGLAGTSVYLDTVSLKRDRRQQ